MLRVAGYWLFYAVIGVLVLIMLVIDAADIGSENNKSPIKQNTKVIGAINGIAIGGTVVGLVMTRHVAEPPFWAQPVLVGSAVCAAIFGIWAWVRIARDLRR